MATKMNYRMEILTLGAITVLFLVYDLYALAQSVFYGQSFDQVPGPVLITVLVGACFFVLWRKRYAAT